MVDERNIEVASNQNDVTDIKTWKNRISVADERFECSRKAYGWDRFIDYFYGIYGRHLNVSIPVVEINEVYAYIKTAVAGLYFRDPYITVNPKRVQDIPSAFIKEQVVNYYWREKRLKNEIKQCIAESKLVGFSYVKIGYDMKTHIDNIAGNTQETVKEEDFFMVKVPFTNILYDFDSSDPLYDSRWVIHWYFQPTEFLRKTYNNNNIKATGNVRDRLRQFHKGFRCDMTQQDNEQTRVFEIWDKDSRGRYLMCDGWDEWLEEPQIAKKDGCIGNLQIEGFPIVMLRWNDIYPGARDNFPMSEIAAQEPQILEKIKLRSMQLNHVKRFSRQVFIRKNALDERNMDKFQQGQDGAIIEVDGDLQQNVWSPQYPNLQTDIYAVENRMEIDRDNISGQSQLERGATAQTKTRTQGELGQILQGTSVRRAEQIDRIEDFCEEIARKIIQIMKDKFDLKKIVRITGDRPEAIIKKLIADGKTDGQSIVFSKEDIQGEEDIQVFMGSTIPLDKDGKFQALTTLLRFGQAVGLTPGSLASLQVGANIVRDLDMKDVELAYQEDAKRLLQPKQPPMSEQLKMAKDKASVQNLNIDTQLKGKRIQKSNLDIVSKMINNRQSLQDLQQSNRENVINNIIGGNE